MSLISTWSTVANANGTLGSTPFYWPEGQAPSTVNDCARLMMATIRTQWNDAQWFNWGYTVARVSGTSFTVVTASANTVTLPAAFEPNGRIKLYDTSTIYGTVTTVSVSSISTLVTFVPDAGSLTASFSSVYNAILSASNSSIPGNYAFTAATKAQQETGTSNIVSVTPLVQQYHKSATKGWVYYTPTTGINASYNVTSNTDNSVGDHTIVWTNQFSTDNYSATASAQFEAAGTPTSSVTAQLGSANFVASSTRVYTTNANGALMDPTNTFLQVWGDLV